MLCLWALESWGLSSRPCLPLIAVPPWTDPVHLELASLIREVMVKVSGWVIGTEAGCQCGQWAATAPVYEK